ncbi:MAG TPA: cytochrome P450 [Pseudonocardiaceae bacterium]
MTTIGSIPLAARPFARPEDLGTIDLTDPATHAGYDLSEVWRHLRAEHPVYRHRATARGPAFWVLTRYADVRALHTHDAAFTSERGNVLDTLLAGGDSAAGAMLPVTDGPRHAALRRLLLRAFTPRALGVVEEQVRRTTRRLLTEAVARGTVDAAADIAAHIPLATICDLLGVPEADRATVLALTKQVLGSEDGSGDPEDAWLARNEILLYFADLAAERRDTPHADVVSLLATAQVDGVDLSEAEVVLNCYSLILGGDETTRLTMTGGVLALAEHPDQWAALRTGDLDAGRAADEVLRWTTATTHLGRAATTDVDLHGTRIAAGDLVTGWTGAANRDPEVFPDPDRFDLARTPNRHLAFGQGRHFCIGAHLARVQLGVLLDELRATVSAIEVTGPARWFHSNFLSGVSGLPVRLHPAA